MTAYSGVKGQRVTGRNPEASMKDPAAIYLRLHTSSRSPGAFFLSADGEVVGNYPQCLPLDSFS